MGGAIPFGDGIRLRHGRRGPVTAVLLGVQARRLRDQARYVQEFSQEVERIEELGVDEGRVNVNGGAIALGHPIGASGARVLVTLLHAMEQRQARRGLAALCLGGGNAVALVVERP